MSGAFDGGWEWPSCTSSFVQYFLLWYNSCMASDAVSITDARKQLAGIIGRMSEAPVYLTRHGKKVAAIIGAEELDRLLELVEDMEDIRAAEQASAELHSLRRGALSPSELIARRVSLPTVDVSAFRADVDAVLDATI